MGESNSSGFQDRTGQVLTELSALRNELAAEQSRISEKLKTVTSMLGMLRVGGGSAPAKTARPAAAPAPARAVSAPAKQGGAPIRGPRGDGQSLSSFIQKILAIAGTPMRLVDIATGVRKAGYPTASKNFGNQVSMIIAGLVKKKLVRKLGRGMYRA